MPEGINLITAVLGLIAAVFALKSSTGKPTEPNGSKSPIDFFGGLILLLIFYFIFIIGFSAMPKIISSFTSGTDAEQTTSIDTETLLQSDEYNSKAGLVYIAAKSFDSSNERDSHLEEALKLALQQKDYELVPKIISSFDSNVKKDKVASSSIKTLCDNNEYKYAIEVALLHESNNDKNNDLNYIIEKINKTQTNK